MNFSEAFDSLKHGAKIRRRLWEDAESFATFNEGVLVIFIEGEYHPWLISEPDVFAHDWMTVSNA